MRPDLKRPKPPRPSISQLAWVLFAVFIIYGAQTMGWGSAGLLLVTAVYVIAFAWNRFRPRPNGEGAGTSTSP